MAILAGALDWQTQGELTRGTTGPAFAQYVGRPVSVPDQTGIRYIPVARF
jgi:hypothetical protein